jgi:hypothetical protein
LAVNTGTSTWNYQVKDLAHAVGEIVHGCKVTVNQDAVPDKRSYKVNFDLYKKLAPNHQPQYDLNSTIHGLYDTIAAMNLEGPDFRQSKFIRLKVLAGLQENGHLNKNLEWIPEQKFKMELAES